MSYTPEWWPVQSVILIIILSSSSSSNIVSTSNRNQREVVQQGRNSTSSSWSESWLPGKPSGKARRFKLLHRPSPNALWEHLNTTILQTPEKVLGFSTWKHKYWFDKNNQEIQELLSKTRAAQQTHLSHLVLWEKQLSTSYAAMSSTSSERFRTTFGPTSNRKLSYAQTLATTEGSMKPWSLYGSTNQVQSPLHSADVRVLLTDKVSILNRWTEHFQTLLGANRTVQDSALLHIHQQPLKMEPDVITTLEETFMATEQLKNGKADWIDGISPPLQKQAVQKGLE